MSRIKLFYTTNEVAEILGVSLGQAYRLMRKWNEDLEQKLYLVIAGKIPVSYFNEQIYGGCPDTVKEAANG